MNDPDPPSPIVFRFALLFVAVAALSFAGGSVRTLGTSDVPSGDVGEYVVQGVRMARALVAGDLSLFGDVFFTPQQHGPVHKLLLGLWTLVAGVGAAGTRSYGLVGVAVGVALFARLGRTLAADSSTPPLALGVALTSPLWTDLGFSAMSESTSLAMWGLLLGTAVAAESRQTWRWRLLGGVVLTLACFHRYNFVVQFLLPLALFHADEARRGHRPWVDVRLLGWGAPLAVALGIWTLFYNEAPRYIMSFLTNAQGAFTRDELAFWTWSSEALASVGFGSVALTLVVAALLACAVVAAARGRTLVWRPFAALQVDVHTNPGLRLLQLVALTYFAAVTAHPFKQTRNLHALVALLLLSALLPVRVRVTARRARIAVGAVAGAVLLALTMHNYQVGQRCLAGADYRVDPHTAQILDEYAAHAGKGDWVVVLGPTGAVEFHLFEQWLWERGHSPYMFVGWLPGTAEMKGQGRLLPFFFPTTADFALSPDLRHRATFVLEEVVSAGSNRRTPDGWAIANFNQFSRVVDDWQLVEVAALPVGGGASVLHIFQSDVLARGARR